MDPLVSPHDTALIEADPAPYAHLVLVKGSARDYLRQRQVIERRITRQHQWPCTSTLRVLYWFGAGAVMAGLLLWLLPLLTAGTVARDAALAGGWAGLGALVMVAAGATTIGLSIYEDRTEAMLGSLDAQVGRRSLAVRDPLWRAWHFLPQHEARFERVLEALTPELREHLQAQSDEDAEKSVRALVEQRGTHGAPEPSPGVDAGTRTWSLLGMRMTVSRRGDGHWRSPAAR